MTHLLKPAACCLLLSLVAGCVSAPAGAPAGAGGGGPRHDLDRRLWRAKAVEDMGLPAAMLIASGVKSYAELNAYESKLEDALIRITDAARLDETPQPLYLKIHAAMHDLVLTRGYKSGVSSLLQVLDRGEFNCLSGTALYVLAARRAGLLASAYGMQGHIMALVFDGGSAHKVETTFRGQSNPGLMQSIGLEESKLVPAELKGTTFDVSHDELAAMFYWNRTADSGGTGDFWENQVSFLTYLTLGPPKVTMGMLNKDSNFVKAALGNQCGTHDCRRCVDLVNLWIRPERMGQDRALLRDLRMECYERWYQVALPEDRCAVYHNALRDDSKHPRMQLWMDRPDARECTWSGN